MFCYLRDTTIVPFSSRWLQLVAAPVKYNHNSIENISTLAEHSYDGNYSK